MDNSNYKVSIITVVYNSVDTIEQTIKSVLGQTYQNIEYIVIDGASTDGTQKIIEKYIDDVSYYVSEQDEGLYYAMNKGLERATGEIVGIINSDDWYDVNAVKNMVECFSQKDAELIYGKTVIVSEDGTEKIREVAPIETIWYAAPFRHPSVFVKKSVYNRFGGFDVNYLVAADYDLMLRFYSEQVKFVYLDQIIAYFRVGGFSKKYRIIGYDENYKISMIYVDKYPYKDKMIPMIKDRYDWTCFGEEISEMNGKLGELLCEYFGTCINTLIIFGTGIWGERCYKALAQTGIKVTGFSDNNSGRWNTRFQGIKVVDPTELKDITAYVLIAVKEHGDEIKRQLSSMGNMGLKCVTISELKEIHYAG